MKRMNIGVIGTGKIAMQVTGSMKQVEGVKLYAVCSRKQETGQRFADKMGIPNVYTDFERMLSDDNIDFIYIAAPNSLHYQYACNAVNHGKNVILEKPFCSNLREAESLVELAKGKGVYLFEAITTLHSHNYKLLKEKLGEIGNIGQVQCNYCQYSSKMPAFLKGEVANVFTLKYSGGTLMDIGVYNLHFAVGLFGRPEKVTYYARKHENGIDLGGTLILEYPGLIVEGTAAKDVATVSRCVLVGDKGYIEIPGGANGEKAFDLTVGNETVHYDVDREERRFVNEIEAFKDIYERGDMEACHKLLAETLDVMWCVEMAKKSADIVFEAD